MRESLLKQQRQLNMEIFKISGSRPLVQIIARGIDGISLSRNFGSCVDNEQEKCRGRACPCPNRR
jgi:hypothetical protein